MIAVVAAQAITMWRESTPYGRGSWELAEIPRGGPSSPLWQAGGRKLHWLMPSDGAPSLADIQLPGANRSPGALKARGREPS